jgi:hypothetical protein
MALLVLEITAMLTAFQATPAALAILGVGLLVFDFSGSFRQNVVFQHASMLAGIKTAAATLLAVLVTVSGDMVVRLGR